MDGRESIHLAAGNDRPGGREGRITALVDLPGRLGLRPDEKLAVSPAVGLDPNRPPFLEGGPRSFDPDPVGPGGEPDQAVPALLI